MYPYMYYLHACFVSETIYRVRYLFAETEILRDSCVNTAAADLIPRLLASLPLAWPLQNKLVIVSHDEVYQLTVPSQIWKTIGRLY